jgi:hypothetical protein
VVLLREADERSECQLDRTIGSTGTGVDVHGVALTSSYVVASARCFKALLRLIPRLCFDKSTDGKEYVTVSAIVLFFSQRRSITDGFSRKMPDFVSRGFLYGKAIRPGPRQYVPQKVDCIQNEPSENETKLYSGLFTATTLNVIKLVGELFQI